MFTRPVPVTTFPRLAGALLLAALLALVPAGTARGQADVPQQRALYEDGPAGRYLLGGRWLLRLDPKDVGERQAYQRRTSTAGWQPVEVPNAWNATDESPASMLGSVAWYRKDFRLPSRASRLDWVVRFESVNHRARAWLNGRPIGSNSDPYVPFELRLPAAGLRRGGVNRLVVRVDNRRRPTDFPPSGRTKTGLPTGGWWNYGGILREVYLRRVDRVDLPVVHVLPELPCRTCPARVTVRARVANPTGRVQSVRVTGTLGGSPFVLGATTLGAGRSAVLSRELRIARPRLWSPERPSRYTVALTARVGGRAVARHRLHTGIRSIDVVGGRLRLNGRPVNVRGVAMHEDDPQRGFALDDAMRRRYVEDARDLGATMLRSHYPLHPQIHELADRLGMLVWSEIPVYALKTENLTDERIRARGAALMARNVTANASHPSIAVWSIGNELSPRPGPAQADYIRRAVAAAKAIDPTRPVGYAVAGYPQAGCQPAYEPLDVIGINEYFGWYPGPNGQIADRTLLSDYLDAVRRCYRDEAVMVTEFGAEANRSGPVEEKGTYEHQQQFVDFHLGVFARKPWLSGAIYWALREFRVRPDWEGGNPRPSPPLHQKGLVRFDGTRKPAFADVQRIYRATEQYPGG